MQYIHIKEEIRMIPKHYTYMENIAEYFRYNSTEDISGSYRTTVVLCEFLKKGIHSATPTYIDHADTVKRVEHIMMSLTNSPDYADAVYDFSAPHVFYDEDTFLKSDLQDMQPELAIIIENCIHYSTFTVYESRNTHLTDRGTVSGIHDLYQLNIQLEHEQLITLYRLFLSIYTRLAPHDHSVASMRKTLSTLEDIDIYDSNDIDKDIATFVEEVRMLGDSTAKMDTVIRTLAFGNYYYEPEYRVFVDIGDLISHYL